MAANAGEHRPGKAVHRAVSSRTGIELNCHNTWRRLIAAVSSSFGSPLGTALCIASNNHHSGHVDRTAKSVDHPMRNASRPKIVLAFLLVSSATALMAQSSLGDIAGVVHDASGANVAFADITLVKTDSGVRSTLRSGADSAYHFLQVPPGQYRLESQRTAS